MLYEAARNDEGEVIYPGLISVRFHDAGHNSYDDKVFIRLRGLAILYMQIAVGPTMSESGFCSQKIDEL